MEKGKYLGGALGVKILTDKLSVKIAASIIQALVVRISGIYGAMFFFSREAALKVGGFPEDRLVAEDSAFAIKLRELAKTKGKFFTRFHKKSLQL